MENDLPLFVDIKGLAERIGVPIGELDQILPTLQENGFPEGEDDFPGLYYWPTCKAWLDRRYALPLEMEGRKCRDQDEAL